MANLISSAINPMIKLARSLRQKKARDENDMFLVEGILHVGEAEEAGWDIFALIYCPERLKSDFANSLVEKLIKKNTRCMAVSESVFESFAEKENPQGIAAIIRQRHNKLIDFSSVNFALAIVSPQDPGNVGSILRTIDGVGADGLILLDGGVEPYHQSVIRASMGSIFWKPIFTATYLDFTTWLEKNTCRIIGTSAHGSMDFRQIKVDSRPTILLLGSEQKGLQSNYLGLCDDLISVSMRGHTSSLNLSVAAGILAYSLKG